MTAYSKVSQAAIAYMTCPTCDQTMPDSVPAVPKRVNVQTKLLDRFLKTYSQRAA